MTRVPHQAILAALLITLLAAAGWMDSAFVRPATQLELASHMWELALLALPITLVIISGGIDLSVGSIMALCAVVLGIVHERGVNIWAAVLLALATGASAGSLNGLFVAHARVHPLIVTLATLSAYRGIAEGVSLARPISGFPEEFALLARGDVGGVPVPAIVIAFGVLAAGIVLSYTTLGRRLYAIGSNETACRYSGVQVARIKLLVYMLSGLSAGLAAVLFVARRNTAKADIGTGIELDVIAAVVLGGTSIDGGRGGVVGTLLGVLLIHELRAFISWRYSSDVLILICIGVLLIGSVLLGRVFGTPARDARHI